MKIFITNPAPELEQSYKKYRNSLTQSIAWLTKMMNDIKLWLIMYKSTRRWLLPWPIYTTQLFEDNEIAEPIEVMLMTLSEQGQMSGEFALKLKFNDSI